MKIFLFILVCSVGLTYASETYSQTMSVNIEAKNMTVNDVLKEIEKQSNVGFFYNNKQINLTRRVSITAHNSDIYKILDKLFYGTNIHYKYIDHKIVLYLKNTEQVPQKVVPDHSTTITGLVTDGDGNPLIGVSIIQKGASTGVITDVDGHYSIKVTGEAVLIFNYIGYNTEERVVKQDKIINVRMLESSVKLDDVVVIGYGQQKKGSVVSSISAVSSKELAMPTRSLTNNLAGQISGIIAIQRSGEPGHDDSSFWIRGVSSFAGGTSPLVLVDGVPRAMKDIEVDEIESFSVLKDASATAVYGAEGANGVVLITSKRGAAQKARLNIRAEFGTVEPTRLPRFVDSYHWADMFNEAAWNSAGNPTTGFVNPYSDEVMNKYLTGEDPDLYPNTDFMSLLKNRTFNQRVTLNLRGGSDKARYFVSGSYYHENGIFDSKAIDQYDANIGLSRYNLRSNIDIDVTKSTLLSVDLSGQYLNLHDPGFSSDDIFSHMVAYAPNLFPLRFSDGKFAEHPQYNGSSVSNPYNMLNESGYTQQWTASLQTGVTLVQKLDFIIPGLNIKMKGSFDADYSATSKRTKTPTSYKLILNSAGEKEYIQLNEGQPNLTTLSSSGSSGTKKIYLEASMNYARTFSEVHNVTGMLLYMQKETVSQAAPLAYKKQSVVARATYDYDSRYLVETSFGLTGSENFASGHRWGIFPSVGLAWYISNEAFMKPLDNVISKLKLRISYGLTGNDNIGADSRFPYRATFLTNSSGYPFGFNGGSGGGGTNNPGAGIIEGQFASPTLTWEKEDKKNVGIDLGLFGGRIDMTIDAFRNLRKDILMQRRTVSATTGFRQSPFQNFGKVLNHGFDGNIVVKQNINKLFLSFRGNVTYARNKVKEYDEIEPAYEYMRYTGNILGKPLLYIADGLYKESDFNITTNQDGSKDYTLKDGLAVPTGAVSPGDIKYKDLNDDGVINNYDMTYKNNFKSQSPEWVYGFGVNAEYKGYYAAIFFQGVANTSVNLNVAPGTFVPFQDNLTAASIRKEALNHWKATDPDNQNVMYPRLHKEQYSNNNLSSTWWYRKGDFLRLKNLEFGYQFDKKALSKYKIANARIYIQGNNLAVWDDVKMWDPELGNANSGAKYPISRTWTLGLELGF